METVLFYLVKAILTSGVMFLYYQLFLKDKTFHHYNRFYLLGTILVSLLLPLLKVSYFTIEVNNDIYLLINKLQQTGPVLHNSTTYYPGILALGPVLVAVLLTGRFVYGIFKILKLRKRFSKEEFEGIDFYLTDLDNAPFSYFKNLFWKNTIPVNSDLGKQVLKHEMVHIEQRHTYDKILIETIKSVFWFNPFFYLIKKEIHLIHEYLADKKAIKQSDTKAFAQMLLANHFSGNQLPATSPLLSANLKKRLKMLKASKTKFGYARKVFALPLLFAIAFACVANAQNKQIKATNIETAQAVNEIEKTTAITQPDIITNTGEIGTLSKEVERSIRMLKQNDAKITGAGKQIRKAAKAIKTLAPDSEAFSEKIKEITILSGKISDIVNDDNFKNNVTELRKHALNYRAALSEENPERIKEDAARAKEAGAVAQEAADMARKQAALAGKQAKRIKEQAKNY